MITKEDLINFEKEVVKKYKEGNTYGPVHLSGGNEEQLIEIFKDIKEGDWVFSTHRSHYHALLKAWKTDTEYARDWLMNEIIVKANSSHINSKKYKIFTSAIVGGIIPIALGVAMGIKRNNVISVDLNAELTEKEKADGAIGRCLGYASHVWCFVGDMASEMGGFDEALKYACCFDLPITFIIEDNDLGCNTPTDVVWNKRGARINHSKVIYYHYKRVYPHYGIGKWVTLKNKHKTKGDYNAYKQ